MVQKKMILLAKKHKTWIEIVCSFGCNKTIAEDIVQEMYIKVLLKLENGLDIMYEQEINYYYIFKVLKTLYIDLKRKGKNITIVNIEDTNLSQYDYDVDYDQAYDKIKGELKNMFWYDRKVFEIVNEGESIAEFSRKSYIEYFSLYNTYRKVKEKLKKLI
jgi:DNA-directed RNA polymerase specialized sigma24 family protein|tara:strand:- start:15 stop:494 length:480 start_codon:yes stop_codon:yes gene_type:complete